MEPKGITVRFAAAADLGFVGQDQHLPSEVLRRKVELQEVFVVERGGQPVGYARLEYLWSVVPYLGLIRVLPKHRRQGVARALLYHIEQYLRGRGHSALYSSSQADEPEPQGWHRQVGFEECGFIAGINGGGVGEVFFRKRLT